MSHQILQTKVLGIGGSLRTNSRTLKALKVALSASNQAGAVTELLDIKELPLPLYDDRKDINSYPESVFRLLKKVREADGLIIATPVYHGSISGSLKNALDFLQILRSEEPILLLKNKIVGLISVARSDSNLNPINSLQHVCSALWAWTLPISVAVPGYAFGKSGKLESERWEKKLQELGYQVTNNTLFLIKNKQE